MASYNKSRYHMTYHCRSHDLPLKKTSAIESPSSSISIDLLHEGCGNWLIQQAVKLSAVDHTPSAISHVKHVPYLFYSDFTQEGIS